MAKQPFYHRGDIHFSGAAALATGAAETLLTAGLAKVKGYVRHSGMIEVMAKPRKKNGKIAQCATFLFTATREMEASEVLTALRLTLGAAEGVDPGSLRVASFEDPEPGDPADL